MSASSVWLASFIRTPSPARGLCAKLPDDARAHALGDESRLILDRAIDDQDIGIGRDAFDLVHHASMLSSYPS